MAHLCCSWDRIMVLLWVSLFFVCAFFHMPVIVAEWAQELVLHFFCVLRRKVSLLLFYLPHSLSYLFQDFNHLAKILINQLGYKNWFFLWLLICVDMHGKLKVSVSHAPDCKLNAEGYRRRIYPVLSCFLLHELIGKLWICFITLRISYSHFWRQNADAGRVAAVTDTNSCYACDPNKSNRSELYNNRKGNFLNKLHMCGNSRENSSG